MRNPIAKFYAYLDRPIASWARVALVLCCVPLVLGVDEALWRISMEAPQYPQGLWLEIFQTRIDSGHDGQDLKEINTLNHYIGMHEIVPADFAELGWMPFALGALLLLALRVAAIGNIRSLIDLAVTTFYIYAFLGARFVYQLYSFGHDLDPKAPFKVEPFTPAILGTKQIANFTTHSFPQLGTYLIGAFAFGIASVTMVELILGRVAAVRASRRPPPPAPVAKP
jgi:copper chaperone NosL